MAENIPAFDSRRWGPGGIFVVGALLVSGFAAFLDGLVRGSAGLQVVGAICLGGGIMVFVVKVAEEIHPVTAKWSIAGDVGEVVNEVGQETAGVVRVRSELWSARSETPLRPGTKVRVIRREGLVAWVARLEEQQAPA